MQRQFFSYSDEDTLLLQDEPAGVRKTLILFAPRLKSETGQAMEWEQEQ
jgi:hypothetical protein